MFGAHFLMALFDVFFIDYIFIWRLYMFWVKGL